MENTEHKEQEMENKEWKCVDCGEGPKTCECSDPYEEYTHGD